jgi:predicted phosphodiesterase
MMRLRYISDLHLEFIQPQHFQQFINKIVPGPNEVAILAGDIGNPRQPNYDIFMQYMSASFKKTFVIAGNHEYYCLDSNKYTIEETNVYLKDYFQRYDNVSFLHNSSENYEGKCFIGTTLWSKLNKHGQGINDTEYIPGMDRKLYNQLNLQCVDFLKTSLDNPDLEYSQNDDHRESRRDCVVITHHLPSYSLIAPKYKTRGQSPYDINQWFYCDLDSLIQEHNSKIQCWFYGHTHTANKTKIGETILACNPIGYPGENVDPDFDAFIEIA